jgi:membrane-bound serine protease (ClpP class)
VTAPSTPAAARAADPVIVIRIDGAIGPAVASRVERGLKQAAREHAQLVVLEMDTPGGLDTSMRILIKDMLAAPMPVAVYVSPSGARAASAGTYMLYAAHIAAMAPATNLGAATPVAVGLGAPGGERGPMSASAPGKGSGDTMEAKRVNDATAYIRSLAQLRGRDVAWAEQAVRESVSLPATEALQRHVIDVLAVDMPDLLRQVDGREVAVTPAGQAGHGVRLATARAPLITLEPDTRDRVLAAISDPSIALLLMLIGIYGLLFEFMSPGAMVPGIVGGVCLLLALWGLQMLPINFAGLALVLLGIAFFVGEALVPSHGALGAGGVAAFALGALMLVESDVPGLKVPLQVVGGLSALAAAFVVAVVSMAARARSRPVVSGKLALVGATGAVIEAEGREGWADVAGERWRVRQSAGAAGGGLHEGERVRVTGVDGLTLEVSPFTDVAAQEGAAR